MFWISKEKRREKRSEEEEEEPLWPVGNLKWIVPSAA
jgi:hypothetical protein